MGDFESSAPNHQEGTYHQAKRTTVLKFSWTKSLTRALKENKNGKRWHNKIASKILDFFGNVQGNRETNENIETATVEIHLKIVAARVPLLLYSQI